MDHITKNFDSLDLQHSCRPFQISCKDQEEKCQIIYIPDDQKKDQIDLKDLMESESEESSEESESEELSEESVEELESEEEGSEETDSDSDSESEDEYKNYILDNIEYCINDTRILKRKYEHDEDEKLIEEDDQRIKRSKTLTLEELEQEYNDVEDEAEDVELKLSKYDREVLSVIYSKLRVVEQLYKKYNDNNLEFIIHWRYDNYEDMSTSELKNRDTLLNSALQHYEDEYPDLLKEEMTISEMLSEMKSGELIFNKDVFEDLCYDLCQSEQVEFSEEAIEALQTISEDYLVNLFYIANHCETHTGKDKLKDRDIQLARMITKPSKIG